MLRTANISGSARILAVALAALATSPSAGPVMVRTRAFDEFDFSFKALCFDMVPMREPKRPRRAEQAARLKAKKARKH